MYTYNPSLYEIDGNNRQRSEAALEDGALLYRIASRNHWEQRFIIAGDGPMKGNKTIGRFHTVDQRTSYCANNILVCFSEMLYHMYRKFLDEVETTNNPEHLESWTILRNVRLATFSVKRIKDLIYVDSIGAKFYDARLISSIVVFPDPVYGPLHRVSNRLRMENKSGVAYPSARHSKDFAFALFKNETRNIRADFYEAPFLTLQLIVEDQDTSSFPPREFNVHTDKLHATMGYYEFQDPTELDKLKARGLIYPASIPSSGYVDFVRRHYTTYPRGAIRP
jgi:hypothetical protein